MATDENDRCLAAPGELEIVRDFVNTRDPKKGTDRIDGPERLSSWLVERGLLTDAPRISEEEVERIHAFREALRAMLLANAGFLLSGEATAAFNAATDSVRLGVRAEDAGRFTLLPSGDGFDRVIGRLLSAIYTAQENGTWGRLKACAECHWALYDHTKNRSAAWCDTAKCGTKVRSRRYRERRRGTLA